MGPDQQFNLRWNNYQSHLSSSFENLLTNHEFVDVTLGCGGKKLAAHKMLLSACSPYLRDLLRDNICPHLIIVLRDVSYSDMSAILKFIYNGEVKIEQDQLNSFLKTADSLKIRGLTDDAADTSEKENIDENTDVKKRKETSPSSQSPKRKRSVSPIISEESKVNNITIPSPSKILQESLEIVQRQNDLKAEIVDLYEETEADVSNLPNDFSGEIDATDYERNSTMPPLAVIQATDRRLQQDFGQEVDLDWESNYDIEQMRRAHIQGLYKCELCIKVFRSRKSLQNHQHQHNGRTYCSGCQRHFSTISNLKTHLKNYHNNIDV